MFSNGAAQAGGRHFSAHPTQAEPYIESHHPVLGGDYTDACTKAIDALEQNLKTQNTTSGVCILNVLNAGRHLWCGNLGDCRGAYIPIESVPTSSDEPSELRFGNLVWISRDLKASDPQEVDRITKAGGRVIEGRVQGVLEPSRTLGDFDVKRACQKENIISIIPEVRYHDLAADTNSRDPIGCGIILLATDGVWDFTSAKDVLEILNAHKSYIAPVAQKARDLVVNKEVDPKASISHLA
jgi:serine/threonine protein phosphatase PrpC